MANVQKPIPQVEKTAVVTASTLLVDSKHGIFSGILTVSRNGTITCNERNLETTFSHDMC